MKIIFEGKKGDITRIPHLPVPFGKQIFLKSFDKT
jgi:hypothetical protein